MTVATEETGQRPVYRAPVEWAIGPLWPTHDPDRPVHPPLLIVAERTVPRFAPTSRPRVR